VKTTQYVRQLKAIEAAETSGIRERWMFGLRLLRDHEVMAESGKSLKHGVAEELIAAAGADAKGKKRLNEQEIQRCIRCARAYPTEAQIRMAATDFGSWSEIVQAGFPAYDAPEGEPPADHRNDAERARDRARALAALGEMDSDQLTLFPLDQYEPTQATLKELADYADEMSAMTERFRKRDTQRQEYVERLIEAACGDMSATWQDAHRRAFGSEVSA
jgi:uncharacterized protein with von Willebrand factor type A (vWA) domain